MKQKVKLLIETLKTNPFTILELSFVRYWIVGTITFLLDFGIFNILRLTLQMQEVHSNLTSTITSVVFNFLASNFWTFRAGSGNKVKKIAKYVLLAIFNLTYYNIAFKFLVEFSDKTPNATLYENLLKAFLTLTIVLWNFLLYKLWIFRKD